MKSFKEQTIEWKRLNEIKYASYKIYFTDGLTDSAHISHVMGKVDYLKSLGNYGSYKTFMKIFLELCEYLDMRDIKYEMVFSWSLCNNPIFNLLSFKEITEKRIMKKIESLRG